ncbi:MAG: hypothetical protein V2J13_02820 [Cycloclasticus sp.]|jgi:hypothetical protein|nr:hypothetical protein [Cycloclasticus sp.]
MDYQTLKTELLEPVYSGLSDADAAVLLNTENISIKQEIESHDIRQYLMLVDLLIVIENGASDAAIKAARALDIFPVFNMANPMIEGKFIAILDGLVADVTIPDFLEAHKNTILSMGNKTISRANELGLGAVREGDIQFARGL